MYLPDGGLGNKHISHLFGRAIFTVNIATVPAVVLPVGQTEARVAAVAVRHLRVILPLPP